MDKYPDCEPQGKGFESRRSTDVPCRCCKWVPDRTHSLNALSSTVDRAEAEVIVSKVLWKRMETIY